MRVLGISGSLRRDSHNTKLLRAAGEIVERNGGQFEVFDGIRGRSRTPSTGPPGRGRPTRCATSRSR